MQLLTICNEGESAPLNNAAGPLLAGLLVLIVVAAYQFYIHFSEIKFYCTLYFSEVVGKDRSLSVAYNISDGVKCLTISLKDLTSKAQDEAEILPKDFPITIAFTDLSLTLKSVSTI